MPVFLELSGGMLWIFMTIMKITFPQLQGTADTWPASSFLGLQKALPGYLAVLAEAGLGEVARGSSMTV